VPSASGGHAGLLAVGLDGTGKYIHWGVIQLSVANLVVIAIIVALFVAAVLLPFPGNASARASPDAPDARDTGDASGAPSGDASREDA